MLHTSATFDEVITIAAGARGFEIGRFDMVPDHPPLMEYLYGLPAHLARPSFPPEPGPGLLPDRYWYAAAFFSERGNDPELLVFLPRLVAAGFAVLLSLAVFLTTRRRFGTPSAVFALLLCAFLPDVLAHGGVAYSDVPLALCWICTLYATDAVVRDPSVRRAGRRGGVARALARHEVQRDDDRARRRPASPRRSGEPRGRSWVAGRDHPCRGRRRGDGVPGPRRALSR
jgi:hypothetical protein